MYVSNGIIHTKDKLFPRNCGTRISTSSLSILILDSWASILDSRFSKVQKISLITFRVETVNLLFSGTVAMTNELTLEVQMTSLRFMFIQLSQLTRWPLYVSPFFSSTNCKEKKMHPQVLSVLMIKFALFKVHQYPPNVQKRLLQICM